MTGTADPGTTVDLWETSIGWNNWERARDWTTAAGYVSATADASGKFTIKRFLDSGFYFRVQQGDVQSERITVKARIDPTFWVSRPSPVVNGQAIAGISVLPNQPGLKVQVQRKSGSSWVNVKSFDTDPDEKTGNTLSTLTGQPSGDQTFRAVISGDDSNGVLGATSAEAKQWIAGAGTPTTPPPSPAVGTVKFTGIQYDSPGVDTGSNGSLNTEWAKLTNTTKSAINLKGWTVRDQAKIIYTFPSYNLAAGASVFIRSGKGTNAGNQRYWGRAGKVGYVWNNNGEQATLRNAAGTNIDACVWKTVSPGYTAC
ncbi:lamin tail domain-containing protein [Actinoplanes sp. LDG1-01]|uniref:Lamin tail domain-containing protein n=2 Tax=Paractinoplanes lichenicola TaxID=2802976 RepID=A0ABS1VJV5_9ACTN|nr:lamin tail domain-containing protein [Actinoplanes lichenicola]